MNLLWFAAESVNTIILALQKIPCRKNLETVAVAVADKLDMLNTAFSLDMIPTGAADPFALRRTAQGIIQAYFGIWYFTWSA